jgi:predicted MFS family arabinose efflux permease
VTELRYRLGGRRAWAVWASAVAVYVFTVLHRSSMGVAGLKAAERFDISASALASFTVVQLTVYALMQVPVGILLDRYGSKRLLITASLLLFTAQTAFSMVHSYPAALAARALLGIGDALVFISVLRVLMLWFPPLRQPVMSQVTGLLGGLGGIVATVPMSAALDSLGWTPTFESAALLSLVSGVGVLLFLRDSPYDQPVLRSAGGSGGRPPGSKALHMSKLPLAEVRKNLRRAWKEPGTRLGLWTHFTTSFSAGTFGLLWGYPFLVSGEGVRPTTAAAILILPVLAAMFCGPVVGRYAARYPFYRSWIVLAVIAGTATMWTAVLVWPGRAPVALLVLLAVTLATGGPGSMVGLDYARTFNPGTRFGAANGIVNSGGFIANLVCIGAVGLMLDLSAHQLSHSVAGFNNLDDFKWAFAFQYLLWLVGTAQILRYRRRARATLARFNPEVYDALRANKVIPLT